MLVVVTDIIRMKMSGGTSSYPLLLNIYISARVEWIISVLGSTAPRGQTVMGMRWTGRTTWLHNGHRR